MIYLVLILVAFTVALLLTYWCNNPEFIWCECFNYPLDRKLNKKLKQSLKSGISYIFKEDYYIKIMFKDGSLIRAWNCNKWYGWLSDGVIIPKDGEAYIWNSKRPSRKTMFKLDKAIKKYENTLQEMF